MALKKKILKKKIVKKAPKKVIKKTAKKPAKRFVKKPVTAKKPAAVKKQPIKKAKKQGEIGIITHYFPHVQAAVIKLKAPLSVGDSIRIKGHTTEFIEPVTSIQIDHVPVNSAKKGQEVGLLVKSRVRQHDLVFKA